MKSVARLDGVLAKLRNGKGYTFNGSKYTVINYTAMANYRHYTSTPTLTQSRDEAHEQEAAFGLLALPCGDYPTLFHH